MNWKEIIAWVAGIGTVTAVLVSMVWGVPFYINTEVERRMNELAIDPSAAPAVVTLQAEVANIEASQVRIERKVDDFSAEFLKYLQRQTD